MKPNQPKLVAVDTNVLLDLACGDESTLDSLSTIRRRVRNARFIVTPTVIEELSFWAFRGSDAGKQTAAHTALMSFRNRWQMDPVNLVPVGHGSWSASLPGCEREDCCPL